MILEILKDAILQNIGPLKQAPKGWHKRHCMLCHTRGHGKDTRNRLGVQFKSNTIKANCFNCGFSASYTEGKELSKSFKFLLKNLGISERFVEEIEFEIFKNINQIEAIREGEENAPKDKETKIRSLFDKWHPMELPKDSLPITQWLEYGLDDPDFLKVVEYALGRRIFDLDRFFWSPDKFLQINQRLIIPYYHKNKIVGFTARLSYYTDGKEIPKYYQQCPEDFVYNLDHQQNWNRKFVILNEGVLDGYVTDGISSLGELGQTKIDIINRLQKKIIVCPDRDNKGTELVEAAIENNWAVAFPKWDTNIKDSAQAAEKYGRLLTIHSILSTAIEGKDDIKIKSDIENNERRKRKRN
jgi:hypothetical protein